MEALAGFAAYFNSIAWLIQSGSRFFVYNKLVNCLYLVLAAVISIFASKSLIRTISLRLKDQADEDADPANRRQAVPSLPTLLRICVTDSLRERAGNVFFLSIVTTVFIRTSFLLGAKLYIELVDSFKLDVVSAGVIFAASAGFITFCPVNVMGLFHILAIGLNVTAAVYRGADKSYVQMAEQEDWFETFRRFIVFLPLPLIIPSVMSAYGVSTKLHKWLIVRVIVSVSVLYVVFGVLIEAGALNVITVSDTTRSWVMIPCVVANMEVIVRALSDTLVEWRYGPDKEGRNTGYAKMVRTLIPGLVLSVGFVLGTMEKNWAYRVQWAHAIFFQGFVLPIIAYCYLQTVRGMGIRDHTPRRYAINIGGIVVVVVAFVKFVSDQTRSWMTLWFDLALLAFFGVSEFVGR